MARIGIITCSNCTQELDCASVVCLADMRKRKGFFKDYPPDEKLDLVGIINCSGCPTNSAPQKILRRVRSVAEFRVDAIHFSFCMTALCPFRQKYADAIREAYPGINIVMGTHEPIDAKSFQDDTNNMLCAARYSMTDVIKGHPMKR